MHTPAPAYMEDLHVGQRFTAGPAAVTAADIIAFGRQYDPQFFHTDPEAAKDSMFGGLIASGWQTAAVSMRLLLDAFPQMAGGMLGRTIENMSWLKPVKPGDALFYEAEITDLRASGSNPARGIMRVKAVTKNQRGEAVMESSSIVFLPRRPA